jgi:hypothetical protein
MTAFQRARSAGFALLALMAGVHTASADWMLGAFIGGARTQDSSIRLIQDLRRTDATITPVHYRSESFMPPIYYGYRVSVFPRSRWLGLEGEFIHVKVIADTKRSASVEGSVVGQNGREVRPIASIIERFSITHGVNLVLANAVVRRDAAHASSSQPRWTLTGRAGVGGSVPHAESTIGGVTREQYEWGSFSLQGAAGAEIHLGKRLYAMGEYKMTRTEQHVSVAGGSVRTPLTTHHVVVGVTTRFGTVGGASKASLPETK